MLGEAWGSLLGSGVMAGTIVALLLSFLIKLTSHRRRRLEVGLDIDALPKIDEFLRDLAPGVEYYRATAAAYWNRGADALYLPWFPWPIDPEQRQILSEIGDPDVLFEKSKRYYMAPRHDQSVKFGYEAPLPVQPRMGADTAPATVSLSVVKDSMSADTTLTLKLGESTSHDLMSVSLNGRDLSCADATFTTYGYSYSTLEFRLEWDDLVEGVNEISVAVLSRPAKLSSAVTLEGVEIAVGYVTPKQP